MKTATLHIHQEIYTRVKEYAKAQNKTISQFVEDALIKTLGLEGLPLEDDMIYGRDEK